MTMTPEEITARAEIHHVLMTYCRGVDRGDAQLLRSVYHPGAMDVHGPFSGTGEEFADYAIDKMAPFVAMSQHHVTNVYMEVDGDEAAVESYFLAVQPYVTVDRDEEQAWVAGRYLDRFAQREGRWATAPPCRHGLEPFLDPRSAAALHPRDLPPRGPGRRGPVDGALPLAAVGGPDPLIVTA